MSAADALNYYTAAMIERWPASPQIMAQGLLAVTHLALALCICLSWSSRSPASWLSLVMFGCLGASSVYHIRYSFDANTAGFMVAVLVLVACITFLLGFTPANAPNLDKEQTDGKNIKPAKND